MSKLARDLLNSGMVECRDGSRIPLHSETTAAQCEFLTGLIRQIDAKVCLEVGLAFGISSLFICEEIASKAGATFISIDPLNWHDYVGLYNLERAGFKDIVQFHGDYSHNVLPKLLADGAKLDFAYVDSTKVFDTLLVDAYYLTRLLKVGGILVLDDCRGWPGPKRLARYLARWPHMKVCGSHGAYQIHPLKKAAHWLASLLPRRVRSVLFAESLLTPEDVLGVNAQCVAFKKISEDERSWDWNAAL